MKKKALTVLLAAILMVVWGHSMMPPDVSSQESGFITRILGAILKNAEISELAVRKAGHFTEYLVLGTVLLLRCACSLRIKPKTAFACVFACFTAAFLDETIQIFSGRGPMIADVWIDIAGASLGIWITFLFIKEKHKKA